MDELETDKFSILSKPFIKGGRKKKRDGGEKDNGCFIALVPNKTLILIIILILLLLLLLLFDRILNLCRLQFVHKGRP